jgi:hypothetical protein
MNPDIEKFWNSRGFDVVAAYPDPGVNSWRVLYTIKKNNLHKEIVGMSRIISGDCTAPLMSTVKCETYLFNNKEYSEEEFLKLIKLMAFA